MVSAVLGGPAASWLERYAQEIVCSDTRYQHENDLRKVNKSDQLETRSQFKALVSAGKARMKA